MVSPSITVEIKIKVGPENNASHATRAKGLISLLKGFTITWPSAHIAEPKIVRAIPNIFPSKLGDPVKIYTPINATPIPIKALKVGFSFNIKKAKITPKGTSVCTNNTAADASIKFKPV